MPGIHYIVPDWPDCPAGIGALATTRIGGVSLPPFDDGVGGGGMNLGRHVGDDPALVQQNRERLLQWLPSPPVWISQVHGVAVINAATVTSGEPAREADASIAAGPGVVCAVMTADCLPVLFADVDGKVVGAAHAGWRGLAAGVLGQTVAAMRAAGAGEITAWMGPAIGAGQFEVGADVLEAFLAQAQGQQQKDEVRATFGAHPQRPDKYLADMFALAQWMLARDGVTRVSGGDYCTASERGRFYSYRRDGVTGRQATLIWIK